MRCLCPACGLGCPPSAALGMGYSNSSMLCLGRTFASMGVMALDELYLGFDDEEVIAWAGWIGN